jgi:hypothetical protein
MTDPARPALAAANVREIIEDELDDFFFGIDNAWPRIRQASKQERDAVRNDRTLEQRIRKRASAMDLLKTYLLLTYQTEAQFPAHYRALIEATDKWGTDEARIYNILRGVTAAERAEMQTMPGVVEVLQDEMSGSELRQAMGLLNEGIERAGTGKSSARTSVHMEAVQRVRLDDTASKGSFDEVEETLEAAIEQEGTSPILIDTALWAKLADHFDQEEVWYLRMIAHYTKKEALPKLAGEADPYVEIIWEAVKGWGTDEDKLIGELERVNKKASASDRQTLVDEPMFMPMLEDELSGSDLRRARQAISASATSAAPIRDTLNNAIDHRDMARIRKLLKDVTLSGADLDKLRWDPVILKQIGDELEGAQLCETVLLLKYGTEPFPPHVAALLAEFQKRPINVDGAEKLLQGLPDADRENLMNEAGVYDMLSRSDLNEADERKLLAAIRPSARSGGESYREAGSEGEFVTHTEHVTADLPVEFTGSEIRIVVRFKIDTSKLIGRYKLESGVIEDWDRAIDEIWNGRFQLRGSGKLFPLVFVAYMAEGIASPRFVRIFNRKGRSYHWNGNLYLYLDGLEPKTVAHEFGHVLGNPDEYALSPGSYAAVTGKTSKEPQTTVKGLMGSQFESTQVEKRHAGAAAEVVNQTRDTTRYPDPFILEKK